MTKLLLPGTLSSTGPSFPEETVIPPIGSPSFTVTESGSVIDPEVLRAEPPGIFDRAFAARGLYPVYPPRQDAMLACIKAIKAAGRSDTAIELLQNAAVELTTEGLDFLLVACSELSLIKDNLPYGIPVVDSIDVLAEAIIAFSRGGLARTVKMGTEKTATMSAYVSGDISK